MSVSKFAARVGAVVVCSLGLGVQGAQAADWSSTEIQYLYGRLATPYSGGKSSSTNTVTIQHASGNFLGDIYFFADFVDDDRLDGINDKDVYTEGYAYFSSSKILGAKFAGPVKDMGVLIGYNYDADGDYLSYLPGGYIDWSVAGFAFLRTSFTAVIDDTRGIANGGTTAARDNGFEFCVSWAYPFKIANQYFSFEGFLQYDTSVKSEFGSSIPSYVLAEPQLRWDVGYALTGKKDVVLIGTELKYWTNKFGDKTTDESDFQALTVWKF